jgi:uncharacterized protein
MIGQALTEKLTESGYQVFPLSRHDQAAPFYYDQARGLIKLSEQLPLHGVINLAGANISAKRWSKARKQEILDSRSLTTTLLAEALAALPNKPHFLLSASAIGFYGDTGSTTVDENSPAGSDFLAQVSIAWEQATAAAVKAGIRTVQLRFGLVLSPAGGVLKNFILPLGLASVGLVGDGRQYMSWISIDDALMAIEQLMQNEACAGPVNLVADGAVTNAQFMRQLATTLHTVQLPRLPAFMVRLMFGEMADAALLLSSRVRSSRLQELGIQLQHPQLEQALAALLTK